MCCVAEMIEEKVWNDRGSQAPDKATAVIPLPEDSYHNTTAPSDPLPTETRVLYTSMQS